MRTDERLELRVLGQHAIEQEFGHCSWMAVARCCSGGGEWMERQSELQGNSSKHDDDDDNEGNEINRTALCTERDFR